MNKTDNTLTIHTLGNFSLTVNEKPVMTDWPDETMKVLFCSLLSPLDLCITWDRICQAIWGAAVTQTLRRRLDDTLVGPLNRYLIKGLGFTPLITELDGIRIDQKYINVDAFEFHRYAVDGLRLFSRGNYVAAREKFSRAQTLYKGIYLPGVSGRIISKTRDNLESLYLTAVLDAMPLTRNSWSSGPGTKPESDMNPKTERRPFHTVGFGLEESLYQGFRII